MGRGGTGRGQVAVAPVGLGGCERLISEKACQGGGVDGRKVLVLWPVIFTLLHGDMHSDCSVVLVCC